MMRRHFNVRYRKGRRRKKNPLRGKNGKKGVMTTYVAFFAEKDTSRDFLPPPSSTLQGGTGGGSRDGRRRIGGELVMSRFNPGKTSAAGGTCSGKEATSFTSGFCGGAGRPQRLRSLIYRNFSYHAQEVLRSNRKKSFQKKRAIIVTYIRGDAMTAMANKGRVGSGIGFTA